MSGKNSAREIAATLRAEQARAERRRRSLLWGSVVAASLVAIAGLTWLGIRSQTVAATTPITGLQTFPGLPRDHVSGTVAYAQTPPVGGKHSAVWQNCGWYDTAVRNENAVHSLEHSAVWVTYSPQLSPQDRATLKSDLAGRSYVLASPYPGLTAPVVASAWGAQVKLSGVTDPRLDQFIKRYANSPSAPEPGGECTGGIGTPSN